MRIPSASTPALPSDGHLLTVGPRLTPQERRALRTEERVTELADMGYSDARAVACAEVKWQFEPLPVPGERVTAPDGLTDLDALFGPREWTMYDPAQSYEG